MCSPVCTPGLIPAVYVFPSSKADGLCVIANIPSTFGILAGDFSLHVIARFNTLNSATLSTILENGITGQLEPLLALYVRDGKFKVFVKSGGGTIQLETSQVPLGTNVTIGVTRHNGICNVGVDGIVVVSMPCDSTALVPAPSSNNIWSSFGVGAQKDSAASCANRINAFTSTVGYVYAIKLIGGDAECPSCLGLKLTYVNGVDAFITCRSRHVQFLPCWRLRRCLPTIICF